MNHFQRRDFQLFTDAKTRAGGNEVGNHFRQTATEMRRLEDVLENSFDIHPRAFIRTDGEGAEAKVQRADIVETKNVICVTVSNQDRIKLLQSKAEGLLSKVGRRIDQHGAPGMFDDD